MKKIIFIISAIILISAGLWIVFRQSTPIVRGSGNENIRGWFWSSNIGWVSTNCYNDYDDDGEWENCCEGGTDCPTGISQAGTNYGLNYNPPNSANEYALFGWAWSDKMGWICFGGGTEKGCSQSAGPKDPPPFNDDITAPWACVGKREPDGSCFEDCGENFNVPNQYSCTTDDGTEDAGRIAHWKFNDGSGTSAKDYSANEHTGTLSGPIWYPGKWDKALKFDGENDYVSLSGSFNDITQTQEAWVKIEGTPSSNYRITSRGSCGNGRLYINSSRRVVWEFGNSTTCDTAVSDTVLEEGKWYHLAGTFDNNNNEAKIYINGKLDKTKTIAIEPIISGTLTIGSFSGTAQFFKGLIDNVAIYNRVKSAEEIWDDSHIEVSGWAKVENLGNRGWLKLKGVATTGDWYGFSLVNWGGSYYSLDGYGWNSNNDSAEGIGWLKGGCDKCYYSGTPIDQDNFRLATSSSFCTQMFLSWAPALWAETYSVKRCGPPSVENCNNCTYNLIKVLSQSECTVAECGYQDTDLSENTGYCWKVVASNEKGEIDITPSPQWKRTTLCAPLTSMDNSICGIIKPKWNWNAESSVIGYNIYRSQTEKGCVDGESPMDDTAEKIRGKVSGGTCEVVGHLAEGLDYRQIKGHWTMNENSWSGAGGEVRDTSEEANHGTAKCVGQGCSLPSPVDGLFAKAGSFDGSEDYIDGGNSNSLKPNDLTFETWIKPNAWNNSPEIGGFKTEGYNGYYFFIDSTGRLHWLVAKDSTSWKFELVADSAFTADNWYHLAGTYDSSSGGKLYINGKEQTQSSTATGNIYYADGNFRIGWAGSSNRFFKGLIDEVSVYSRAKTAEEIKIDYEAGRCLKDSYCAVGKTCSNVTCGDLTEICNSNNCGEAGECCYIDQRIIPQLDYYYRITSFTKDAGESPPSIPQRASTLCYPPIEMQER